MEDTYYNVSKYQIKRKVLQFVFGAPWRCTIHWRGKLMQRFYWSERLIWKEFYWTLCTVRSTNTYDRGVLLWLMSSVLASCEVLWLSTNLHSANKNKGIQIRCLGQKCSLMKSICPTQRDIEIAVAIHYVWDVMNVMDAPWKQSWLVWCNAFHLLGHVSRSGQQHWWLVLQLIQ